MPNLIICPDCKNGCWQDRPCPECEQQKARNDARMFGSGFLRFQADGRVDRIDPAEIYLKGPKPNPES